MKYYIISGEASGDLHGSNLMRALLERQPDAQIRFWGGDRMAEVASLHSDTIVQVKHIRDLAYMGFVEVVSHLKDILGNIKFCKQDILDFRPDVVVFIDYPGFNLKIAKFTHKNGLHNVYYISPQIWAWKKNRIRPMRRDLDRLCYILPSERKFYSNINFPQAIYVGHPLLDEVERFNSNSIDSVKENDSKVVALLPGSRKQEIKRMLPLMVQLAAKHPEYHFFIAGMNLIGEAYYRQFVPEGNTNIDIRFDGTYRLLSDAFAAVVCSGTATLEAALFRVPQVVCYQCNIFSAAIARLLVGNRVKYISLVNLIADRPVVRELIQGDFNLKTLDLEFEKIAADEKTRTTIASEYNNLIDILGGSGASERTADEVIEMANNK